MKVLAIGPSPPPTLGTSIPFKLLCDALHDHYGDFEIIDTNAITRTGALRWLRSKEVLRAMRLMFRAQVILLAVSRPKIYILGSALVVYGWLTGKKIAIRNFGGDLDQWYKDGSSLRRLAIRMTLSADVVFLETSLLLDFAKTVCPQARITWLANYRGIEPAKSSPENSTALIADAWPEKDKLRLIFIGHVSRAKGVDVLCEAMEQCGGFASLVICGKLVEEDLSGAITRAGANFMGQVDNSVAMALLKGSDVLVCPSNALNEGHPGVAIEAFMFGKPVVASNWRSIPEVVVSGKNGLLFEPRDSKSLAARIREIADPALRARLAHGTAEAGKLFSDVPHWQAVIANAGDAAIAT